MSKYFGFKAGEGYSRVIDFKSIREDINEQLGKIELDKSVKRAEIAKNTAELEEQLASQTGLGAHDELNRGLHDLADQIKYNKLMQYELAKSGQQPWSSYNKFSQDTKGSLASIQSFMASLQVRADKVMTDDNVFEGEIELLDRKVGSGGFFKENKLYQDPSGGGISLVSTDEEGNIRYDENGQFQKVLPPSEMVAYDRTVLMKTDFETNIVNRVATYAQDIKGGATQVSTVVEAVNEDITNQINALSNKDIVDYLSQEGGEDIFGWADTLEEQEESIKIYDEKVAKLAEIAFGLTIDENGNITEGKNKDGSEMSEEEIADAQLKLNTAKEDLSRSKLLVFIDEGVNGAGIDFSHVKEVHRDYAAEIMKTDYYARIGTSTNAPIVQQSSGYTIEEKKYKGYAKGICEAMQDIVAAGKLRTTQEQSQATAQAIGRLRSLILGQKGYDSSVIISVKEVTNVADGLQIDIEIDDNKVNYVIRDDRGSRDAAKALIELGGAANYNRYANDYNFDYNPALNVPDNFRGATP